MGAPAAPRKDARLGRLLSGGEKKESPSCGEEGSNGTIASDFELRRMSLPPGLGGTLSLEELEFCRILALRDLAFGLAFEISLSFWARLLAARASDSSVGPWGPDLNRPSAPRFDEVESARCIFGFV